MHGAAQEFAGRVSFASVDLDSPVGRKLAGRYGPGTSTAGVIFLDQSGRIQAFASTTTPEEMAVILSRLLESRVRY